MSESGPRPILDCGDPDFLDMSNENGTGYQLAVLLFDFKSWYSVYHPTIAVILCVVGLLANAVHIWVLSRPRMRSTSVHTVLTCIAIADIGTMTSYLVYMIRFEFNRDDGYLYGWALFLKIHVVLSIALHAIGLYLVVLMAFIRVSAMKVAKSSWLHPQIAALSSLLIAFIIFVLCIPTLLSHHVFLLSIETLEGRVRMKYSLGFSDMVIENRCALLKMNLWLTGVLLKATPCFLLFGLTLALIARLRENRAKRKALLKSKEDAKRNEHTTYMLLLMVAVFLCTELIQGVMAILNAMYTSQFHQLVYQPLADVLDLLSLINCYVGFLVYVSTSSRYRQTLWSFFTCCSTHLSALSTRQNTMVGAHREKNGGGQGPTAPSPAPPTARTVITRYDSADVAVVREQLL